MIAQMIIFLLKSLIQPWIKQFHSLMVSHKGFTEMT